MWAASGCLWNARSQHYSIENLSTELRHVSGAIKFSVCSINMFQNAGDRTIWEGMTLKCTYSGSVDLEYSYESSNFLILSFKALYRQRSPWNVSRSQRAPDSSRSCTTS